MEVALGSIAFVVLSGLWVVLPSQLRKRRQGN